MMFLMHYENGDETLVNLEAALHIDRVRTGKFKTADDRATICFGGEDKLSPKETFVEIEAMIAALNAAEEMA